MESLLDRVHDFRPFCCLLVEAPSGVCGAAAILPANKPQSSDVSFHHHVQTKQGKLLPRQRSQLIQGSKLTKQN